MGSVTKINKFKKDIVPMGTFIEFTETVNQMTSE